MLHEQATQALRRRVADIESRPPTPAGSSAPPSSASSHGGRDPFAHDPTILRANVPGLASAAVVWETFQQVVVAAKCRPSDFEMVGSARKGRLAKRLTFRCKGTKEVAAQRAKEVAHSLRLPAGQYKQLSIRSPTGADIPLYLSLDTAVAHLVRKRATKRVADALRQVGPLRGRSRWSGGPLLGVVGGGSLHRLQHGQGGLVERRGDQEGRGRPGGGAQDVRLAVPGCWGTAAWVARHVARGGAADQRAPQILVRRRCKRSGRSQLRSSLGELGGYG